MQSDSDQTKNRFAGALGRVPGLRRRRIRIWAAVVLAIVVMLGLQECLGISFVGDSYSPGVILLIFLAALGCEFVDSSLGMGYGTTLTPLLLLAGFEPLAVVPCVLCSELVTGLLAAFMHQCDGNVDFLRDRKARGTAILLSVLSVVGAVAAVTIALKVPKVWLSSIIAIIILSVGVATLATLRRQIRYSRGQMVALGAVAAFNKGLSGGGYGPLVTAGQVVSGMSPKHAVAITSLAEAWTCLVGLVAYVALVGQVNWTLAVPLTVGAVLSVPVATLTVRRLPEVAMRASVGGVTCLLGVLTLAKLFL
jgi:uncharacterized membrane protein YfcA